jgi:hypothetical protein
MGTLFKTSLFSAFLLIVLSACQHPEDRFIGKWEYDSYKAADSGLGALAPLVPENWKTKVDQWIENGKDLTNSTIEFKPDGTYVELFRGGPDRVTKVQGQYTVMNDLSQVNLKNSSETYVMPTIELTDSSFTYEKKFDQFQIPLTLEITYKRVKINIDTFKSQH